ncbi:unnamed protein product [Rhizophagus irregularis]|nr:unnamed protein product [Rhizophagus irregularis]
MRWVTFFVAGHDTTSMSLSTSLYYLAKYPEMQEKARAEVIRILGDEPVIPSSVQLKEMKYINAIIKESLRVYPPAPVKLYWTKFFYNGTKSYSLNDVAKV